MEAPEAYRLLVADVLELAGTVRRESESIARAWGQTTARWHVLSVFSDVPLTVASGARRLGLARQNVQRVVNELILEGMLSASPNPDHRVASLIRTSETGRDMLAHLTTESDLRRERLLSALDLRADELLHARTTVQKVVAMFDLPE